MPLSGECYYSLKGESSIPCKWCAIVHIKGSDTILCKGKATILSGGEGESGIPCKGNISMCIQCSDTITCEGSTNVHIEGE